MATVRQLAKLITAHLGVDVVPYAARLVKSGLLSRRDEEADAYDAAYLIVATMAAATPDSAAEMVEAISELPLHSAWRLHDSIPMGRAVGEDLSEAA